MNFPGSTFPTYSTIAAEIEAHQRELLAYTRPFFGKTNLDIGCGNGITSFILQRELGISPTLCDVTDIRAAEARAFPFYRIDSGRLPFPDQSFDSAYLQYVLHHLPTEPAVEKLLAEARRVARRIIIVEEIAGLRTNLTRAKEFDREVNERIHPGALMPVFKYYTRAEIGRLLEELRLPRQFHIVISTGSPENGFLETQVFVADGDLALGA